MKKKSVVLSILLSFLVMPSVFAGPNSGFDFHVDGGFALVRGSQFAPVAGLSFGLTGNVYGLEVYGLGEMMFQPGGSKTGKNAVGEVSSEAGVRFLWTLFRDTKTISHLTVDVGYFAQWLQTPSVANTYYRMHNGVMIRPGISTIIWEDKFYQMEIGVYYQKTLLPSYTDYDGVVVLLKLL